MGASRPDFHDYGVEISEKLRGEHAGVAALLLEQRLAFPARASAVLAAITAAACMVFVLGRAVGASWVGAARGTAFEGGDLATPVTMPHTMQLFLSLAFVVGGAQALALILSLPSSSAEPSGAGVHNARTRTPTDRLRALLRTYNRLSSDDASSAAAIVALVTLQGTVVHFSGAMDWIPRLDINGNDANPAHNLCLASIESAAWLVCLSCAWPRVPRAFALLTPFLLFLSYSLITLVVAWASFTFAIIAAVAVLVCLLYATFLTRGAAQQWRLSGRDLGDRAGTLAFLFGCPPRDAPHVPESSTAAASDQPQKHGPHHRSDHVEDADSRTSSMTTVRTQHSPHHASGTTRPGGDGTAFGSRGWLAFLRRRRRHGPPPPPRGDAVAPAADLPWTLPNPIAAVADTHEDRDRLYEDVAAAHLAAATRLRLVAAAGMAMLTALDLMHFLVFIVTRFTDGYAGSLLNHTFIAFSFLVKGVATPALLVQFILLVRQRLASTLHDLGREAEARLRVQEQRGFVRYICHEIRVPLTTITLSADEVGEVFAELDGSVRELSGAANSCDAAAAAHAEAGVRGNVADGTELLAGLKSATESLNVLVSDVLNLEKLVEGKFSLEPRPIDVPHHLRSFVDSHRAPAKKRAISLFTVWAPPPEQLPAVFEVVHGYRHLSRVRRRRQERWLQSWAAAAGHLDPVAHGQRAAGAGRGPAIASAPASLVVGSRVAPHVGSAVESKVEDSAPAEPSPVASLDPSRLQQVLGNVLSNSLKFARSRVTVLAGFAAMRPVAPPQDGDNGLRAEADPGAATRWNTAPAPAAVVTRRTPSGAVAVAATAGGDPPQKSGAAAPPVRHAVAGPWPPTPEHGRVLCVGVFDDGVGISAADARRLFQAFVQIRPGAGQDGKGTGLGLTIAQSLCQLQGGVISAWSAGQGLGTAFWFAIPVPGAGTETADAVPGLGAADVTPLSPTLTPWLQERGSVTAAAAAATRQDSAPTSSRDRFPSTRSCSASQGTAADTLLMASTDGVPSTVDATVADIARPEEARNGGVRGDERATEELRQGAAYGSSSAFASASAVRMSPNPPPAPGVEQLRSGRTVGIAPGDDEVVSIADAALLPPACRLDAAGLRAFPPRPIAGPPSRADAGLPELRPEGSGSAPTALLPGTSDLRQATRNSPLQARTLPSLPAALLAPPTRGEESKPLRGARLLVVDDSKQNRDLLQRKLQRLGATEVLCAADGGEAVDIVRAEAQAREELQERTMVGATSTAVAASVPEIHAVLMDGRMAPVDGFEAATRLRDLCYRGTIVGVTGDTDSVAVARFEGAGADTVIAKPTTTATLLRALQPILPALGNRSP